MFRLVTFLNILHVLLIGVGKILFVGFVSGSLNAGFLQAFTDRYVGLWLLIPVNDADLGSNIAQAFKVAIIIGIRT